MVEAILNDASSEQFLVRRLAEGDLLRGYRDLVGQLTEVGDLTQPKFDGEAYAEALAIVNAQPDCYYDIVVQDRTSGTVVGNGRLLIEQKFFRGCARMGHVEDIVVSPTYRRHGLGSL